MWSKILDCLHGTSGGEVPQQAFQISSGIINRSLMKVTEITL